METLQVTRADGVVTITLNRPDKMNAINATMWRELGEALTEITSSGDDRAVVLTGAGRAFCSGADLSRDREGEAARRHQLSSMREVNDVALLLHKLPQPSIAKVTGVAAGAGCNLALGCDLIVASDDARFSEIFSRRGLSVDFGGTWLLPRLVGLHKAKELAFFGDVISAREAQDLGIVNRVVAAGEIDEFVADWAIRLAAGPPIAVAQTKQMLNQSLTMSLDEALIAEGAAQTVNLTTHDAKEAIAAFLEKRDPEFSGR